MRPERRVILWSGVVAGVLLTLKRGDVDLAVDEALGSVLGVMVELILGPRRKRVLALAVLLKYLGGGLGMMLGRNAVVCSSRASETLGSGWWRLRRGFGRAALIMFAIIGFAS